MAILGRAESVRRLQEARSLTLTADAGAGAARVRVPKSALSQSQLSEDTTWMGSLATRS
jgi:glutamyl-tRNA synthetase